jgi:peptidoglycan/LPS O-acetylase OafA/YrhL
VTLDFYRFVAALGVLFYHFLRMYGEDAHGVFQEYTKNFYLFVDFFFILSGFVITYTYYHRVSTGDEIVAFLRKRLARIYPLHVVTLALYVLFAAGFSLGLYAVDRPQRYDLLAVPQNLLMIHAWGTTKDLTFNYPSWSISAEWFMYLLFPVIALLCRRARAWGLLVVAAGCVLVLEVITRRHLIASSAWTGMSFDFGALRAIPTFTVGVMIGRWIEQRPAGFRAGSWVGLVFFVLSIILMMGDASVYLVLASFALTVAVTAVGDLGGPPAIMTWPAARALGDASYSIYMLHPLFGTVFLALLWKRGVARLDVSLPVYCLIVAGLVCSASVLSYIYFERPARLYFSGRKITEGASKVFSQGDGQAVRGAIE